MYLRRWRTIHAEAEAFAQDSDSEPELNMEESSEYSTSGSEGRGSNDEPESSDFQSEISYEEEPVSSDSEDEFHEVPEEDEQQSFTEKLASWCSRNKHTRKSTNELLAMLREEGLPVPKDSRTLQKTPRSITVEEKCGGQYKYFGLEFGIRNVIEDNQNFISQNLNSINLKINIDGVPLFKSSSMQFWPILCSFENFKPFLVSIFYGNSKPSSVSEFLEDFLEEYSQLKTNGLQIEDARLNIKVRIKAFICDAPARALIKGIKGHTGYYACERCTIKGYWKNNRIILYSKDECSLRTDEEFSLVVYDNHQTSVSPLIEHGIVSKHFV